MPEVIKVRFDDKAFKDFTDNYKKNVSKELERAESEAVNVAMGIVPAIINANIRSSYDNPKLGELMAKLTDINAVPSGNHITFIITGNDGIWGFHELGAESPATSKLISFSKDEDGGGQRVKVVKGRKASSSQKNVNKVFRAVQSSRPAIQSELTTAFYMAVSEGVKTILNNAGAGIKVDRSALSALTKAGYNKGDLSRLGITKVKVSNGKINYHGAGGRFTSGGGAPTKISKSSKKKGLRK